jgi:hypothetical protein
MLSRISTLLSVAQKRGNTLTLLHRTAISTMVCFQWWHGENEVPAMVNSGGSKRFLEPLNGRDYRVYIHDWQHQHTSTKMPVDLGIITIVTETHLYLNIIRVAGHPSRLIS